MLPIGQQLWLNELKSYRTYPPLQAPETYNLDGIIAMVKKAHENHPSDQPGKAHLVWMPRCSIVDWTARHFPGGIHHEHALSPRYQPSRRAFDFGGASTPPCAGLPHRRAGADRRRCSALMD